MPANNIITRSINRGDNAPLRFGTVAKLLWETADANANELILVFPEGGAVDVPVIVIGDASIDNVDLGWFNGVTEPTVAVVNDAADAYVSLDAGDDAVAGSKGLYFKAAADEDIELVNLSVTGTPRVYWDESEDQFRSTKGWVFDAACDVQGTWVATATWTIPPVTLGGAVAGGDQQITNVNQLVLGSTTAYGGQGANERLYMTSLGYGGYAIASFSNADEPIYTTFAKSRGATAGTYNAITSGDEIARIVFRGSDATDFQNAAYIKVITTGTIGDNRVPGQLEFHAYTNAAPSVDTTVVSMTPTVISWNSGLESAFNAGFISLSERAAPGAGAADIARIYAVVGGDTFTDLAAVFQDGTVDIFAQEVTPLDAPHFTYPSRTPVIMQLRKPHPGSIQWVFVFPDGKFQVLHEIEYHDAAKIAANIGTDSPLLPVGWEVTTAAERAAKALPAN